MRAIKAALVRHATKLLSGHISVQSITLPDRQTYKNAAAYALHRTVSTKQLARSLDASVPYAHRIRHGERDNPIGEAAAWLHALAKDGADTEEARRLLDEAVKRGHAEYVQSHPYLKRA